MANFYYNKAAQQGNSDAKLSLAPTPTSPAAAAANAPVPASAPPTDAFSAAQQSTRFANTSGQVLILVCIFFFLLMGRSIVLGSRFRNSKYA
jgi:TPR repeat protein